MVEFQPRLWVSGQSDLPSQDVSIFVQDHFLHLSASDGSVLPPPLPPPPQVCQVSAQQPVQTELLMRYHQLQSRLATLKIENEEVRIYDGSVSVQPPSLPALPPKQQKSPILFPPQSQVGGPHHHLLSLQLSSSDPLLCGSREYI